MIGRRESRRCLVFILVSQMYAAILWLSQSKFTKPFVCTCKWCCKALPCHGMMLYG